MIFFFFNVNENKAEDSTVTLNTSFSENCEQLDYRRELMIFIRNVIQLTSHYARLGLSLYLSLSAHNVILRFIRRRPNVTDHKTDFKHTTLRQRCVFKGIYR